MTAPQPPSPHREATYTMLWPQHVVKPLVGVADGKALRYALGRFNAQTDFARFRIAPGDVLIPVHLDKGRLCPIARMRVTYKGTVGEWRATRPDELPGVAPSTQLLAGEGGTPMYFFRPLPAELVRALRYDSTPPRALPVGDDGRLTRHTGVDGVFRLHPESADELLWLDWV